MRNCYGILLVTAGAALALGAGACSSNNGPTGPATITDTTAAEAAAMAADSTIETAQWLDLAPVLNSGILPSLVRGLTPAATAPFHGGRLPRAGELVRALPHLVPSLRPAG